MISSFLFGCFGSCVIFKHRVTDFHFSGLKRQAFGHKMKMTFLCTTTMTYRCQSRTFVDSVISFFSVLRFIIGNSSVLSFISSITKKEEGYVSYPLKVLKVNSFEYLPVKRNHLLLLMLVMVELGILC